MSNALAGILRLRSLWRGVFFAALAIAVLVAVSNGAIDAPFLYSAASGQ